MDDMSAIRKVVEDAERLQSDLDGFTGLLTRDAVIVNFGGRRVRGRDDIYAAMKQALQTPLADVLTRNELEDVRFLRPDVALVSLVKQISDEREPAPDAAPLPERGNVSFVLVKEDGSWLIALAHTTPIRI